MPACMHATLSSHAHDGYYCTLPRISVKLDSRCMALEFISVEELGNHCTAESLWVAVHGVVYDLTTFLNKVARTDLHVALPDRIYSIAASRRKGNFD